MATTFAVITAAVSALNAGFSPPELAKKHQDAARAYGHLERPLAELLYKLDEYNETEYVPQDGYDAVTKTYYDAGFYRAVGTTANPEDLRAIWEVFSKDRERIETIDENAPSLMGLVWGWGRHETSDRPIERSIVSA